MTDSKNHPFENCESIVPVEVDMFNRSMGAMLQNTCLVTSAPVWYNDVENKIDSGLIKRNFHFRKVDYLCEEAAEAAVWDAPEQ